MPLRPEMHSSFLGNKDQFARTKRAESVPSWASGPTSFYRFFCETQIAHKKAMSRRTIIDDSSLFLCREIWLYRLFKRFLLTHDSPAPSDSGTLFGKE